MLKSQIVMGEDKKISFKKLSINNDYKSTIDDFFNINIHRNQK